MKRVNKIKKVMLEKVGEEKLVKGKWADVDVDGGDSDAWITGRWWASKC